MKTLAVLIAFTALQAQAAVRYELTITNGSQMPVSPAAVYAVNGQKAAAVPGQTATGGFVQLCQTGNPANRVGELSNSKLATYLTQTTGPILPGESKSIEIEITNPSTQSIHFEAMYAKTKDLCAVGSIDGHTLVALQQHAVSEYVSKDDVLATGAFTDPAVGHYPCQMSTNAVSCLRELSMPTQAKIHFFTGYLPSVVNLLESKFGAAETQSLLIPTSGAVQFSLVLKH
jgi:hypothetical protein